jgi:hypothetical protein
MCSVVSLPVSVVCRVCECIVNDQDPLHSMSQRLRTLGALAATCKEVRALTTAVVYPRLSNLFAGRVQDKPCPTLDSIAFMDDAEVHAIAKSLCRSCSSADGTTRAEDVHAILGMSPRYWHLVPLRDELRLRRNVLLTVSYAKAQLRLRASDIYDVVLPGTKPRVRQEDAVDRCMARFGSSAALTRHDHMLRIAAQKRAATFSLRARRMEDLGSDMCVLARHYHDLNAAVNAYACTGCESAKAHATCIFYQKGREIDARKQEMGPMPPAARPTVLVAYIAYLLNGDDQVSRNVVQAYWRSEHCVVCGKNSAATACTSNACRMCCLDSDCGCANHRRG